MGARLFLSLYFMLLPAMAFGFGFGYHCGVEENRHILGLPYLYDASEAGDEVNIYLVFVSFDDSTGVVPPITEDFHGTFLDVMREWLPAATYNKLRVSEESKILLPHGVEFNDGTADTWLAAAPIESYTSGDFDEETYPTRYVEAHEWGMDNKKLSSEIMCQIYDDYWVEHGIDLFSDSGNSSVGWEVHFVYLRNPDPSVVFAPLGDGIGGVPGVYLSPDSVPEMFGDYFDGLTTYPSSFNRYAGTQNIVPYVPVFYDTDGNDNFVEIDCAAHPYVCNKDMFVRTWIHEYVHTWGVFDGPPNLNTSDDVLPVLAKYFYGNLHIECQHMPAMSRINIHEDLNDPPSGYQKFRGIPPLADPALARLPLNTGGTGASTVINFTGESLRDVEIEDVSTGGQFYRYDLGVRDDGQDEYFLVAYHAGLGLDQQHQYDDPSDGRSTVPSQGIAIWHCIGRTMWDLESASGLYDYGRDGDHDGQPIFVYPEDEIGVEVDRVLGYDNYDRWYYRNSAGSIVQRGDVASHDGRESDFFLWNEADPSSRAHVFSYATNPNNFGYEDPGDYVVRRSRQDVPNTLIVNVKETVGGNAVKVDLLSAPGEVVTPEISAGTEYQAGELAETFEWSDSWSHDEDDNAYDLSYTTVEVHFSGNGGADYDHIEDVSFEELRYYWRPGPDQGTSQGKLQFRFFNSLVSEVYGYYDLPSGEGQFFSVVGGCPEVHERLLQPNGGERLLAGDQQVRWSNDYGSDQGLAIDQVDIGFSFGENGEITWPVDWTFVRGSESEWDTGPDEEYCYADIVISHEQAGDDVWLYLRTHFLDPSGECDPVIRTDSSDGAVTVYPVNFTFESVEGGAGVDYSGHPGGVAILADGVGDYPDIFVPCFEDPEYGVEVSKYYENDELPGVMHFQDRTLVRFAEAPGRGYVATAAADVDEDGYVDLFLAHETSPKLYVRNGDDLWADVANFSNWFEPLQRSSLAGSGCATWTDYDHDGDLDLCVGRTTGIAMFENRGEGAAPRFSEVTLNCGLNVDAENTVTDCIWADVDGDGLWEVLISYLDNSPDAYAVARFFDELSPGVYVEATEFPPNWIYVLDLSDVELIDIDSDNDVDLVAAYANCISIFRYEELGDGFVWEGTMSRQEEVLGIQVGDIDCDGGPDLVVASRVGTPAGVGYNLEPWGRFGDRVFEFMDDEVGLGEDTGNIGALGLDDFDSDGDLDLLLGANGLGGHRFSKAIGRSGDAIVDGQSVVVRLVGLEDNVDGIGAKVSLEGSGGAPLGAQYVAGSGDRGGQPSTVLRFGIGDYVGSVRILVDWPLGRQQELFVLADGADQAIPVEVVEEVGLAIDDATVSFTAVAVPGTGSDSRFDWVFEWRTDHWSDSLLDKVEIIYMPPDCIGQRYVLQHDSTSGVYSTVKYAAKYGDSVFLHRVEWQDAPCMPGCTFTYTVSSSNGLPGGVEQESASTVGAMPKLCTVKIGGI